MKKILTFDELKLLSDYCESKNVPNEKKIIRFFSFTCFG